MTVGALRAMEPEEVLVAEDVARAVPETVLGILTRLRDNGHAAYVVGGSVRDVLLGRAVDDWDMTTDARPDRLLQLFPAAAYENAFGTVAIPGVGKPNQVTTFRSDHDYADFRRPHRVEFGGSVEDDLARRDFTVNAIAWGWPAGSDEPALIDPSGGRADIARRTLRAVGDPDARFREDALRTLRAVRLAATLGFEIEPATLAAIAENAPLAAHLSGERIAAELDRLLAAERPSVGLRLASDSGLIRVVMPELDAQRGIRQNKVPGEDLWDHTLRTVDAAPPERPVVRLAALVHDIGKPATLADGRFPGHDRVGAEIAATLLRRLKYPKAKVDRVAHLVRNHMFFLETPATDAAVRRFIVRIGERELDDLFALREADNVGSGVPRTSPGLDALRRRVAEQLAARVALDIRDLAVDGDDVMAELGLPPGPAVGRVLTALLEGVIAEPSLNDRATLLRLAHEVAEPVAEPSGE